ncbi:YHS domain-containing protein [Haloferula luteola]|uniref:YHS domain-containing protein n=1 Tax=Haloferula luteola TaxID=595692 RepID=A0A840VJ15_9BACT|nr:hypothetical protein [Haloferula luteola]MBB5353779.1 YHS domain-containing protein [Haloferula luteola]
MKFFALISSVAFLFASCSKQESATTEAPVETQAPVDASAAKPYPLKVCLVSGEELGTMGEPVVIVHEGQQIQFCCSHCVPEFKEDPAKFLAKLEELDKP